MASLTRLFLMAAFVLVIFSAGNSSMAQSFGDAFVGVGDNDEPVNIEAERLEVIDKQKTAVLSGNVKVIQGTTVVRSKEMRIFYFAEDTQKQTRSGIERIEISGGVDIRSNDNTAKADQAVINLVSNEAVLTGNIILSQGENMAEACSLWVDLNTRHTKLNHACDDRIKIYTRPSANEAQ